MSNKKIVAEDFVLTKENKKNFKESQITRLNMTSEFTIADLESDLLNLDRMEREANGQVKVSTAAIENISRNHKLVSKLDENQLAIAAYLHETKTLLSKAEKTLKEVKDAKKLYKQMLSTVYSKFGFVETTVSNEQAK